MPDFGPEFIVNTTTAGNQNRPTVAALLNGQFVVTWYTERGTGWDIRARLFDADGNPIGNDFLVNTTTAGNQFQPTITALPNGHFVVTWIDDNVSGSDDDIRARVFDEDGTPIGDDFLVNTTTGGMQDQPTVAALPNGQFVVTWWSNDNGTDTDIRARLFNADGTPVGDDFLVNSTTENHQFSPTLTTLPNGQVVVTWYSNDGGDGSGTVVRARILSFETNTAPVITSNGGGDTATILVDENNIAVTTVTATDPNALQTVGFSKVGGADADLFTINSTTGVLTFVTAPDFEAPSNANGDNIYEVTIQVSDGKGGIDTQAIAVNVTNVSGPKIVGGNGGQTLNGTSEDDTISGGNGNDVLKGNSGNDNLSGGNNDDTLNGDAGNDVISGGNGNDIAFGGTGNDNLSGGNNDDTLNGEAGNDVISGGNGNDILNGGAGNDTINGDLGNDVFVFAPGFGNDKILQFDANPAGGQDLLDISSFGITGATFAARVTITYLGADALVTIDGDLGQSIRLVGIVREGISQSDFIL